MAEKCPVCHLGECSVFLHTAIIRQKMGDGGYSFNVEERIPTKVSRARFSLSPRLGKPYVMEGETVVDLAAVLYRGKLTGKG